MLCDIDPELLGVPVWLPDPVCDEVTDTDDVPVADGKHELAEVNDKLPDCDCELDSDALGEVLKEGDVERLDVPLCDAEGESEGDVDELDVALSEGVTEIIASAVARSLPVCDVEGVAVSDTVVDIVGVNVCVRLGDWDGDGAELPVALGVGESVRVQDGVGEPVCDGEGRDT